MARNWENSPICSLSSYFKTPNFVPRLVTIVTNTIKESYKHDNPFKLLEIKENLHFNSIMRRLAVNLLENDTL